MRIRDIFAKSGTELSRISSLISNTTQEESIPKTKKGCDSSIRTEAKGETAPKPQKICSYSKISEKLKENPKMYFQSEENQNNYNKILNTPIGETAEIPKAYAPYIDGVDISYTMDHYIIYVNKYNEKIKKFNKEVEAHNKTLVPFEQLTQSQKMLLPLFYKKYGDFKSEEITPKNFILKSVLTAEIFNKEAEIFNSKYGEGKNIIFKMKTEKQPIKYATELFFRQIVVAYSKTLYKKREVYKDDRLLLTLPSVDISVEYLMKMQRKTSGEKAISASKNTVKRHRARLIEAGVLVNYIFNGVRKTSSYHINPEILTFSDAKTEKRQLPHNKQFKILQVPNWYSLYNNTRSSIQDLKINTKISKIEILPAFESQKNNKNLLQDHNKHRTANLNDEDKSKKNTGPAKKIEKNALSESLRAEIMDTDELVKGLAGGDFDKYTPLKIDVLRREVVGGDLSPKEFANLTAQDFLKTLAGLYKGKNIFVGTWKNAIDFFVFNHWFSKGYDFHFKGYNFHSKGVCLEKLEQYRWRIDYVKKFMKKNPDYLLLYPSEYLNPEAKTKRMGGFAYTEKAFLDHQARQLEKKQTAKNKQLKTRVKRLQLKTIEQLVREYIFGGQSVNYQDLQRAVQGKMSLEALDILIADIKNKYKTKKQN